MSLPQLLNVPLKRPQVWLVLGWLDIVQSYRRSALGPVWLTLSMVVFSAVLTLVYGGLFKTDTREYLVYLVCGMIVWTWISTAISEGGNAFQVHASFIKGTPLDKALLIWATAYKHLIVFAHHFIVYLALVAFGLVTITPYTLLIFPAVALLFLSSVPLLAILAILFIRYRDLQRLSVNLMAVIMFLTPIFWKPEMVGGWRTSIISLNPFYYFIELIRHPLLGMPPDMLVWAISIGFCIVLWLIGLAFYARFQRYVAFWI